MSLIAFESENFNEIPVLRQELKSSTWKTSGL